MRYGYQDMPDSYTDLNPELKDAHRNQTYQVCGEEYDVLVGGICSECVIFDLFDAIHYGG